MAGTIALGLWDRVPLGWGKPAIDLINWERFSILLFQEQWAGMVIVIFFLTLLNEIPPDELFQRCSMTPSDPAAWREFLRRYKDEVRKTIFRILQGRYVNLCDDAMQRFYEQLLGKDRKALGAFQGGKEEQIARAYLCKIAASAAYKTISGEKPDKTNQQIDPEMSSPPPDPLLRIAVDQCLNRILHGRNKYRNMLIFKLAVLDGFKPVEIIQMLGGRMSSVHAVEQQILRTLEKLRRCLKR